MIKEVENPPKNKAFFYRVICHKKDIITIQFEVIIQLEEDSIVNLLMNKVKF